MNETVEIKFLVDCPEVIPTLASWVFREWGEQYKMASVNVQLKLFADRVNRNKIPLTMVAFLGFQPVGTASLKIREMTTHTHLLYWLAAVYVDKQFRGRGIGTELILCATEKARDLGIDTLYLHTSEKVDFYSNLGWEEVERTIYYEHEVAIMKKELK